MTEPARRTSSRPEDRIVVVKSEDDTPYGVWIKASPARSRRAGGVITLQLEEEKEVETVR